MAPFRILTTIALAATLALAPSAHAGVSLDLKKADGDSALVRDAVRQLLLSADASPATVSTPFPEAGTCSFTSMSCNSTVSGSLGGSDCTLDSDSTYLDFWTFSGTSGQKVTITMRSTSVDSYLALINPDGTDVVAEDNNSGGGLDARIVYTLNKSGTWAIAANQLKPATGSYSLQLQCETGSSCTPQARATTCGQTVSGTIDAADCTVSGLPLEFWGFTGTAGQPFTVTVSRTSGSGNLGLVVIHEDAVTVLGDDSPDASTAKVSGTLPKSGTWLVAVVATGSAGYTMTTSCQGQSGCTTSSDNLCLNGKRFRVIVAAKDPRSGKTGSGLAIPYNDINGFFALPALTGDTSNFEVFVKVLDGRAVNGKFWVFYGGLTDFEYTITVTDTATGVSRFYTKPGYQYTGGADTSAF